jgi:hypothetical protein
MNCWTCRDIIAHPAAPVAGEPPSAAARAAADHLSRCAACREFTEQWSAVGARLGRRYPAPEPPAAARAELVARLVARRPVGSLPHWRRLVLAIPNPSGRWASVATLAVILVVVLLSLHGRGHNRVVDPHPVGIAANTSSEGSLPVPQSPPRGYAKQTPLERTVKRGRKLSAASPDRSGSPGISPSRRRENPMAPRTLFTEHLAPPQSDPSDPSDLRAPTRTADELASLNPDAETVIRHWAPLPQAEWSGIEAKVRQAVRVRDDFVQIPFPQLAAASTRQVAEAVEQYKKEAAVVDPRLSREVSLGVKAIAFSDLCDRLKADTGIEIAAGRSVADEKLTVFCEKRPLRDVMRAINQVFGFAWLRSGEAGKYRYELTQDLRSQLLEEELRNRDLHTALVALDDAMTAYKPDLALSHDELERRLATAEGAEKQRLRALQSGAAWAAAQLYQRLTGAQRLALANGEALEFKSDAEQPDQRLPAEWQERLSGSGVFGLQTAAPEDPSAKPTIGLQIDRSELGQLALRYHVSIPSGGGFMSMEPGDPLAVGQSPSLAKPDNAGANHALRADPLFQRPVSFKPRPSCPWFAPNARPPAAESSSAMNSLGEMGPEPPHVSTADVWEAVHQKTGLPIIADAYSRFYPLDRVTVERLSLFDALDGVAEPLGVRWRKEGDFLLCRSTRYFWDRLKEVPNRYLVRWQQDRRTKDGLPFEDFLEMAALSDQQLDSTIVGQVIDHCWGLKEWGVIGSVPPRMGAVRPSQLRPFARFAAGLTPDQRRQTQQPEWLAIEALTPRQQEALARALQPFGIPPQSLAGLHLRYDYIPAGWYVSEPWGNPPQSREEALNSRNPAQQREEALKQPAIAAPTREAALAAARRLQPTGSPADIHPSPGIFAMVFHLANGRVWEIGWPMAVQ